MHAVGRRSFGEASGERTRGMLTNMQKTKTYGVNGGRAATLGG